jgi:citronellyl-CoA dehydrogenase
MWITNSLQADWMCLLANTSEGAAHRNKSLIILPMKSKGISKSKIHKIGMMSSDTGLIHFDDVRVPQRYRIGDEGSGFTYQMQQFQEERLWAAASSVEGMLRTLNDTIAYIGERKMFGRTVLDFQYVHYRLAELKTEIEALRALTYRACELYVDGGDVTELASMAKLKSGRLRREVSDSCLQYWGGMGFTWDNPASRAYRDGRLGSIGGGADEVMLGIICKYMHILPKGR